MAIEKKSNEEKKIEVLSEDLNLLEAYINDIFTFSPLPFCFISTSGVILESNPAFEKFSGYSLEEIIGKSVEDFVDDEVAFQILNENKKKGSFNIQEANFFTKDEKRLIVQIFTKARKDEKGNFLGYFLSLSDLTEIKINSDNSRRALMNILEDVRDAKVKAEEERNKTLTIIHNFADGILLLDSANNLSLINPQAEYFFKVKAKNVIGKPLSKIAELKDLFPDEIKGTFRKKFGVRENLILETTVIPIETEKKKMGNLVILHDVTREKLIEEMKTEFVSLAAHQLRTPLSAVKWILKMLLDEEIGEMTEEQKEFLRDGYISNQRMIDLVNDLLSVARIEEGRYLYNLALADLEKTIEPLISSFRKECRKKKISFIFKKPKEKIPKTIIDTEKIVIAFENIIDNAIKYSFPGGKITVSLKFNDQEIEACIKDTGMGIPNSQKKFIFNKFFRGSNVVRKETDGNGLGLFIVKNIVEAHQGRIWFDSEENKGTSIFFTIPIKKK